MFLTVKWLPHAVNGCSFIEQPQSSRGLGGVHAALLWHIEAHLIRLPIQKPWLQAGAGIGGLVGC